MKSFVAIITPLLLTVTFSTTALAATELETKGKDNDCGILHVQVGNSTQTICQLTNSKVVHGNLVSSPPATLPSGFSGGFDIKQSFYGPEVVLEYNCAGQQVSFSSQQNYCFMSSGRITGNIVNATSNLTARSTSEEGSYLWSKPGIINWVLAN